MTMKFIHKRNGGTKGGLTVGYVLDEVSKKRAAVTVARCKYTDNYSRSMGRLICENRYEAGVGILLPVDPKNVIGSLLGGVDKLLKEVRRA